MEWLENDAVTGAVAICGGTVMAFFGWDFFRVSRLLIGAAAGGAAGWIVFLSVEMPYMLEEKGFTPVAWAVLLIASGSLVGALAIRLIRSLGSFLFGGAMAFLAGKIIFTGLFSNPSTVPWWSIDPPAALAAGIAGGAAALLNEKLAVILLTSFLGSYLAGSVLPWKYFPLIMFAMSAPIQWWIQAGRPLHLPFRKGEGDY